MLKRELDSSKIKILVCCHKPCEHPKDDIFLPIQVGAAISDVDLGIQRDDQVNGEPCDNISAKNKTYCELTAIYWAWKNIKKLYPDLEYIGLCHYRRYFDFETNSLIEIKNYNINSIKDFHTNRTIIRTTIEKAIGILPSPIHLPYSVKKNWFINHYEKDIENIERLVTEKYPSFKESFEDFFYNQNFFSQYNMFILPVDYFMCYADWLFSIMFDFEKKTDLQKYSDYQSRLYGFLAERLLNVYIKNNKIKVKYSTIAFFDETPKKNKGILFYFVRDLIRKLIFFIKSK